MGVANRREEGVSFLRQLDSDWAGMIDLIGPCLHAAEVDWEPYEALIRGVAHQQLSTRAGDTIIRRLVTLYPNPPFPTPENIIATKFDALRACGFSANKVATIQAIAEGAVSGLIPPRDVALVMDDEELIERITKVKGIGRWTVEMMLIFTLGRPDILPVSDFGVREGYKVLKNLSDQPKPKVFHEIGKAWAPHRTAASWYLWRVPRDRGSVLR